MKCFVTLVLLPTVAAGQLTVSSVISDVAITMAKVAGLVISAAVVGRRIIPALLDRVAATAADIIVAVSIVSIVINPLASRLIAPAERLLIRALSRTAGDVGDGATSSSLDPGTRAIVIGYGPTGRTVTRLLQENGIAPTVVELNMDTVRQLRQTGISAVYGDARHHDSLIPAGLRHAGNLIISGDAGAREITQIAREINPRVHIFVRSLYLRDVQQMRAAGAEQVFSEEGEVALAMTEAVLRRLGAPADQIDRERDRVRAELFPLPVQ